MNEMGCSYLVEGNVPDICLKMPCLVGIDGAGRGPVLGPMVYAICCCPLKKVTELHDMGFADSKTLTEEQRELHFEAVKDSFLGWSCKIITPRDISSAMLRGTKYNLNQMSHDVAVELVEFLRAKGVSIAQLYVDTVGDAMRYQKLLEERLKHQGISEIFVSPKADSLYPIVSAASICAKVQRDRALKEWHFSETSLSNLSSLYDFGSGYPGDPETKRWLYDHLDRIFGFPSVVRFSWSTCVEILKKDAYMVDWNRENDIDPVSTVQTISKQTNSPTFRKRKADYLGSQHQVFPHPTKDFPKIILPSTQDRFYIDAHLESLVL